MTGAFTVGAKNARVGGGAVRLSAARARRRTIEREEAEIAAGIAADPDTFEPTDEQFAKFRPTEEILPELVAAYRRTRGPQKAPTKKLISIRLDPDVIEHFRSTGEGWQGRINATLRKIAFDE